MTTQTQEPDAPGQPRALADDVEPATHEREARIITGIVTVGPIVSLLFVAWQLWDRFLGWNDIFDFLIMYVLTAVGVTVGFHRLFTHRSFKSGRAVRATLGILGSAAIEGPVIAWVSDHRKHHRFSDCEGDPHSPHVNHGDGWSGALRDLPMLTSGGCSSTPTAARRAATRPTCRRIRWSAGSTAHSSSGRSADLFFAAFLGWLFGGTWRAALTGLLWGGAVRMLVVHHVTYSVNSLCHFFGRRRFETGDESRNLAWLAPFTFGEAWHNNHHAFPTSAEHGMRRWEFDPSALIIRGLERVGLVWDVIRISPERQAAKLAFGEAGDQACRTADRPPPPTPAHIRRPAAPTNPPDRLPQNGFGEVTSRIRTLRQDQRAHDREP